MTATLGRPAHGGNITPRQQDLQKEARRLFALHGYHRVSIKDITQALDISPMALYRHYPSKQALLVAVLETPVARHLAEAEDLSSRQGSPCQVVRALIRHHTAFVLDEPDHVRVWRTEERHLPLAAAAHLRGLQHSYHQVWLRALRSLRPDLSDEERRCICLAALSLLHSCVDYDAGSARETVLELLAGMAFDSLGLLPSKPVVSLDLVRGRRCR